MLIGPVGKRLKGLLNEKIKIPNEVLIDKDEVHLILEYNLNQQWNGMKPPQSNRFIVSHDVYNSRIEMLDIFFNLSKLHNPDVLILAGFHLVESQNEEFR
jgi:ADP-dependent phosphofructokinase/glucokinase